MVVNEDKTIGSIIILQGMLLKKNWVEKYFCF